MPERVLISDLQFIRAPETVARDDGLLGWVSVTLAGVVRVEGIAIRIARDSGATLLSWPARRDARGRSHAIALPLPAVRDEVNRAILAEVRAALQADDRREVKAREAAP